MQKTAYELRISDWSSDVCSSDLTFISALIALATMRTDIMEIVVGMGFGLPALAMLLLSIWTINALNLYSAGLSLAATFPGIRQGVIIVAGGLIGCIFALLGLLDHFLPFLVTLGLILPTPPPLHI